MKEKNIIGSDETGVGDYFSPLVCCAAFVPYQNINKLKNLGVKDSKLISDNNIKIIAEKIKPYIIHSIKLLSQRGYNKLSSSFNANELKMILHMSAINSVEERVKDYDFIVIDQFSTEDSINKYKKRVLNSSFKIKDFKNKFILEEKAESKYISVAAASIIARAKLLDLMNDQNEKWKTVFPLGTNKIVENFALNFVKKNGERSLEDVSKINFKTTKIILEKIKGDE